MMFKMSAWLVVFSFVLGGFGTAKGAFIDDFNGSSLDPAWGSVLTAPTQATAPGTLTANNNAVSGGTWNISSMTYSAGSIGSVYVRRNVALHTAGDFVFTMDFSANPASPNLAYGYLDAMFLDANFNNVVGAGWFDDTLNNANAKWQYSRQPAFLAANGANLNNTNVLFPVVAGGATSLPNSGYGRLVITKQGSDYTIQIGMAPAASFAVDYGSDFNNLPLGTLLTPTASTNANPIQYLQLQFSSLVNSPFQMAIHQVSLIPEPTTFSLAALGLLALCGIARKRRE